MSTIVFATLDADGQPVEAAAGRPLTVYRQRVDDDHEAAIAAKALGRNVVLGEFVPVELKLTPDFLSSDPDILARYGVQRFEIAAPAGERLASYAFELGEGGSISVAPAFEPIDIPALRASVAAAVKAEAERRILSRYPVVIQLNMIRHGESLAWIDEVRTASNAIEAAIPNDAEDIAAFDVTGHPGWPA